MPPSNRATPRSPLGPRRTPPPLLDFVADVPTGHEIETAETEGRQAVAASWRQDIEELLKDAEPAFKALRDLHNELVELTKPDEAVTQCA